jgi:TPR repeat protein
MAVFQLPELYGGYLEKVKIVVKGTIYKMRAANQYVYNAEENYELGNAEFGNGNYKLAYYYYSKAYSEATFVEEPIK